MARKAHLQQELQVKPVQPTNAQQQGDGQASADAAPTPMDPAQMEGEWVHSRLVMKLKRCVRVRTACDELHQA